MDDEIEITVAPVDDGSIPYQLGKHAVSGLAAFAASKLADRLYDGAIRAYRARKSS